MTEYTVPITTSWSEADENPHDWNNYGTNYESTTMTWERTNWTEL
tara:strand:- start:345 stop:479 length:135 start_codon:yes stop_codon:yes gene_type:complete